MCKLHQFRHPNALHSSFESLKRHFPHLFYQNRKIAKQCREKRPWIVLLAPRIVPSYVSISFLCKNKNTKNKKRIIQKKGRRQRAVYALLGTLAAKETKRKCSKRKKQKSRKYCERGEIWKPQAEKCNHPREPVVVSLLSSAYSSPAFIVFWSKVGVCVCNAALMAFYCSPLIACYCVYLCVFVCIMGPGIFAACGVFGHYYCSEIVLK